MRFSVLGPLEVSDGGVRLTPSRRKERTLLALLLVNAGRTVSTGEVNHALWGAGPPPSARSNLYTYVTELRRILNRPGDVDRLTRVSGGYFLRTVDGEVDAPVFEGLVRSARDAVRAGRPEQAVLEFGEALRLWRGSPLMDVAGGAEDLRREAARLEELRLVAVEDMAEANMAIGNSEEVAATLPGVVDEHPLRERLWSLLILAWYRTGRQGEALAAYQRVYRLLGEELGVEPGQGLKEVHRLILSAEEKATAALPSVTPRQLPVDTSAFVGRADELAEAPQPGIAILTGPAGVGKTALALRWARRLEERFPDGQLYVDLGEHAMDGPLGVVEAHIRLLAPFGVAVPREPHQSAALYRSVLAGRRLLVVLDNAVTADQVRPLLPGTPSCMTIVTSRDTMTGLVAGEGARRTTLRPLSPRAAVELLGRIIGQARVTREQAAAGRLADLCGRLPLMLRVAAAQLADDPTRGIAEFVAELVRDGLFERLSVEGDRSLDVRASFSHSHDRLAPPAQAVFRLLAGSGPLALDDVACRLAMSAEPARAGLAKLVAVHLAQREDHGRFTVSEVLRHYAASRNAAAHAFVRAAV